MPIQRKNLFYYKEIAQIYLSKDINDLREQGLNKFFLQNFENRFSYSTIKVLKSVVNRALVYGKEKKYIQTDAKVTVRMKQPQKPTVMSFKESEIVMIENFILKNKKFYLY